MPTLKQVYDLLEWHRDERGVTHWEKNNLTNGKWSSFGIGLTRLKSLARQLGKPSTSLAAELRTEPVWECQVLAILLEDPTALKKEQAIAQVDALFAWMLSHIWCSTLAPRLPYRHELAESWITDSHQTRRRCGWLITAEISKKDKQPDDPVFSHLLTLIERDIHNEENYVRDAMNSALLAIGSRNAVLYEKALAAAKKIGPIEVDYGDNSCKAPDVAAHLSSSRVRKKVGLL